MSDASTALEIIRSVSQTMQESDSTEPALQAVVKLISEKMQVDVCSIYLHETESDSLRLAASQGLTPGSSRVSMSAEEGLTGHSFSRGEIINIANPGQDRRNKYFPGLGEDHLGNFLGIPIPPTAKRGAGVLTLQSTEEKPFSPMVEDLAYTLAAQLGTLLENRSLKSSPPPQPGQAEPAAPKQAPPFVRAQVAVGGIADGRVVVLKTHQIWETIFFAECEDPQEEIRLLQRALEQARSESLWLKQRAGELFAELDARIFEAHEMMLADEHYIGLIESYIRERMSAPFAVKLATRELAKSLQETGNPALASKAADLRDVGLRILNALGDVKVSRGQAESELGNIVAAVELLPSDLIYLSTRTLLGIMCETGGLTSHAAILARSLGIPCFMGIPGLTSYLQNGTRVIMDGNSGLIYIDPDAHVQREYQRLMDDLGTRQLAVPGFESMTRDGKRIRLSGNLSLISDLELMDQNGIEGVGLYRSEFFFMIRNSFPDEETQFQVYKRVLERCGRHGATFRLLDVGGDKPLRYFDWGKEENPSLGWRSVRMLLQRPDILKPHLRALLRTAQLGDLKLVIPMLSLITELREIRERIDELVRELEAEHGRPFRRPPLGSMIEIPSAVFQIGLFARESDFLSIGTNDLIQYLFAIDRGNERVSSYYQPFHPVLIQALTRIAAAAREAGKPVTVCGEMASDPEALPIFLGLGITELSIAPAAADGLRAGLRRLDTGECQKLLGRIVALSTAEEVREEVRAFLHDERRSSEAPPTRALPEVR